jgi:hypothetical protein
MPTAYTSLLVKTQRNQHELKKQETLTKQQPKKTFSGKTQQFSQYTATALTKNTESDAQLLQKKMLETILAM